MAGTNTRRGNSRVANRKLKLGTATLAAFGMFCARADAAQAGDNVMQIGWLHIQQNSSSTPLYIELEPSLIGSLAGVQSSFSSPGTSAVAQPSDTAVLILTHFLTAHLAVQAVGGIPARVDVVGGGTVAPTGLLGEFLSVNLGAAQNNPLVSVQEWTPAALLQYYFGRPAGKWHPYVGIGISYAWFSGYKLNGAFKSNLESNFGNVLSLATGQPGATTITTSASRSINPLYNAGLSYDISQHWGIAASLSYGPVATTATIDVLAQDGTVLADAKSRLTQNALVTALLIDYRFRFGHAQ